MAVRNGLERWRGEVTEALADIKRRLDEQRTAFETLGTRFDAALQKHADDDAEIARDFETRVGAVEKSQAGMRGRMAVVSALIGAVVGALADKLWR